MNRAKFSDNGGCGYVLKPGFLNEPDPNYSPCSPFILQVEKENTVKVTVVSGQHIPRPDGSLSGEVIDPYVEVRVRGHPDDKGNKEATEYVKNNGFNPVWNQTFQFNVKVPALAFLDFRVKDHSKSGKDQNLGAFSCPLSMVLPGTSPFYNFVLVHCIYNCIHMYIATNIGMSISFSGYRRVMLNSYQYNLDISPASLLVRIQIEST